MGVFGPVIRVPATSAPKIVVKFNCDISVSVNDLVVHSMVSDNTAVAISSNVYSGVVLGVVQDKPSDTECNVLVFGELTGLTSLTVGKLIFVGTDGSITHNPPTTGGHQIIGTATSSTSALLHVEFSKVVRV